MLAVTVDHELRCSEISSKDKNGITIHATAEIAVCVNYQEMFSSDAAVILPTDSLETEYYINGFRNYNIQVVAVILPTDSLETEYYINGFRNYNIQVVAVEPNVTTVNLKLSGLIDLPSGAYSPGETATETLQQYETWNIIEIARYHEICLALI